MNNHEKIGLILVGRKVYEFIINSTETIFEEYGKFNRKFYRTVTQDIIISILMKKIEIKDYFELFRRCVKYPYNPNYTDIYKCDGYGDLYYNANRNLFVFISQGEYTLFTEDYILDLIEKGIYGG